MQFSALAETQSRAAYLLRQLPRAGLSRARSPTPTPHQAAPPPPPAPPGDRSGASTAFSRPAAAARGPRRPFRRFHDLSPPPPPPAPSGDRSGASPAYPRAAALPPHPRRPSRASVVRGTTLAAASRPQGVRQNAYKNLEKCLFLSVLNVALLALFAQYLFFSGLSYTTATLAATVSNMTPVFTFLIVVPLWEWEYRG
ncbi:Auxin-induced protein 5NG4 [Hordeum vulgare]|nr:Auxin-induced protein 5NG4 [Hordeum vulgare]